MYNCHPQPSHQLPFDQGAQIKIYPKFSGLCIRTNQSHLAVFCIDKNTIGCYDFFQVWVLQVNRLSNSNSTSVQKTNKAMATKCNRVVTQEKRRKSIGEGRENCISGASRSLLHLQPYTRVCIGTVSSLFFLIRMLYRGFLPFANSITVNFITVIIQKNP